MKAGFFSTIQALIIFLVLLPVSTFAQETGTCAERLKSAQSLFERGQVEKVPEMLGDCMRSGFKREEQLQAYKLLIQSYLLEDKLDEADSAMLAFLKKFPEYQLSQTDHPSFVTLHRSFRVRPLAQITFHIGTNIPYLTGIENNSNSAEPEKNYYKSESLNLFTSLELKIPLTEKIDASIEAGFLQSKFINTERFLGFETVYTEKIERLEIPVSATYNFARFGKNFTAFARAGAGLAMNLKNMATPVTTGTDNNNRIIISGADLDVSGSRIFTDFFLQAGAGIRYKTPGGFISLEARSVTGLRNQVVPANNEASRELAFRYSYQDDDFRLNNINISIGYTQIFYKPAKRKQGE